MTSYRIESLRFDTGGVSAWARSDQKTHNWPIVYTLDRPGQVYVGETINAVSRFQQHLASGQKRGLQRAHVVVDATFNKSVCLDLESYLIRLLAGDGKFQVLNRNDGITEADYYERDRYREGFRAIFEELRDRGLFERTLPEIQNSDLFKLSPFKALTQDQGIAVEDILEGLFEDLREHRPSRSVIKGDPGTGKTVIGIFLMKLLSDIQAADGSEIPDEDTLFSDFFLPDNPPLLSGFRVGLVVPQQSLRKSIRRVFAKTPGLSPSQVLSPFDVGASLERFDVLIVDETHRLTRRANQSSGLLNKKYAEINVRLFGYDDPRLTQIDWMNRQSEHQIYLMDAAQSVRPADVDAATLRALEDVAAHQRRVYALSTQMRIRSGEDYVAYVGSVLDGTATLARRFSEYDLRLYDDFGALRRAIWRRDDEVGLSRLVAGYAWAWQSKSDPSAYDIEIDRERMRWNSTPVDWVDSATSRDEVGSIHTIQGYDLNYAGVIIGNDLRYDQTSGGLRFDNASYFDKKGRESNRILGQTYSDEELLVYVRNIYRVLLTRGMLGTYVYVCDPALREHLSHWLPTAPRGGWG